LLCNLKIQIMPLVFYGYYIMEPAKAINPIAYRRLTCHLP